MSALDLVKADIVGQARAQGFELAPWFELNQNRLRVFSDGLQRILGRVPFSNGDSDRVRAEIAHSQLRSAIERLRSAEEVAWFDRNRPLLLSVGAAISHQQRERAAIEFSAQVKPPSAAPLSLASYEPWGLQYDKATKIKRWAATREGLHANRVGWRFFEFADRLLKNQIPLAELRGRRGESMPPEEVWHRMTSFLQYEGFGETVLRQAGDEAETDPEKILERWGSPRLFASVEGVRFYGV